MRATGWTLDYIDGLPLGEWVEYLNVMDFERKMQEAVSKDRERASAVKRGR